jgi:hypothetical protein
MAVNYFLQGMCRGESVFTQPKNGLKSKKIEKTLDLSRKNNYFFKNFLGRTASELGIFGRTKAGLRYK